MSTNQMYFGDIGEDQCKMNPANFYGYDHQGHFANSANGVSLICGEDTRPDGTTRKWEVNPCMFCGVLFMREIE